MRGGSHQRPPSLGRFGLFLRYLLAVDNIDAGRQFLKRGVEAVACEGVDALKLLAGSGKNLSDAVRIAMRTNFHFGSQCTQLLGRFIGYEQRQVLCDDGWSIIIKLRTLKQSKSSEFPDNLDYWRLTVAVIRLFQQHQV